MPLLLGHRGTPRLHPENTVPSFQAALDAGLDGVEWDVRRLGDGTLVIHHDAALSDGRPLATLTHSQWPDQLPTLHQALAWAADTGAFVNVEIKSESWTLDDRTPRTLDAIRVHGLSGRALISSFFPHILRAARESVPRLPRALLIERRHLYGPLDLVPSVMRWTDCTVLHPHHSLIHAPLMALAQRQGWQVNAWTVNDSTEVQRLVPLGIHGLIGDEPEVLRSGL